MDMTLLRSFLAVADHGAITDAAEHVGVTQSAMSRRIQQLEDHLGATLLTRGRKGAQLTEIGKLIESEARLLVSRFEQLREQVATHQTLEKGSVRIGGGATAVSFLLPGAIAAFQADYPGVLFQLKEAGSSEIADQVLSGRLELGVVTLPVHARDLHQQPLMTDRIVLVARRDHPLSSKSRVQVQDLSGQAFVGFEGGTALRNIIDNAVRDAGVDINVVMELRSIPAILRMVSTTGNLAFVSQLGVASQNDVCEVTVQGLKIERELAVISRHSGLLSPAATAFSERLHRL